MLGLKKGRLFYIGVVFLTSFLLISCGKFDTEKHTESEPDVISSIGIGNDDHLTIVANREEIEDKAEFAKLLVDMCKENSFKTIKFSTDYGYSTSLEMRVYLWKDEIEGNEPIMIVKYKPVEWNKDYDIVNHPEMFELYVDGELIEY